MTEIENLSSQFPNGVIPKNIRLFLEFLADNDDGVYISIETFDNSRKYLEDLIPGSPYLKELIPFAADTGAAVFAIWNRGDTTDLEKMPVVYLNTEGVFSVAAANFADFVLVFSYELIWDLISSWRSFIEHPDITTPPTRAYNAEELESIKDRLTEEYPNYPYLVDVMRDEMHIDINRDPVAIVEDAVKNYPNLEELFRTK